MIEFQNATPVRRKENVSIFTAIITKITIINPIAFLLYCRFRYLTEYNF